MKSIFVIVYICLIVAANAQSCDPNSKVRSYDGTCNNLAHPARGSPGFFAQREGFRNVTGLNLPNERTVSNRVFAAPDGPLDKDYDVELRRTGLTPDPENRNAWFVAFSQFVAHDISQNPLTFNFANFLSNYKIQIDPVENPNDPLYQPSINGKTGILTIASTGETVDGVFYSRNDASNYVDLSTVYGSSQTVADKLRAFYGGRLATDSTGMGLPFASVNNTPSECGAFRPGVSAAGDLRSDENGQLTAIHTMFMRIHNIYADSIASANPTWTDEQIFQEARNRLIAVYQNVVYEEFLPLMLGAYYNRFRNYRGYDSNIDVTVTNSFATAAFRVIHDMVPLPALILYENCTHAVPPTTAGVPTQESSNCIPLFFRETGMDAIVRGALDQFAQAQDAKVVNGLRSVFLQASTPGGNLDVESANLFRGREHGLPDFNTLRQYWSGKSLYNEPGCVAGVDEDSIECFQKITTNATKAAVLQSLYKRVNRVDAYVGMLTESLRGPVELPPVATEIIADQFERLRRGDRFYFENEDNGLFTKEEIKAIKKTTMSDLMQLAFPNVPVDRNAFLVHDECNL